MRTHLPEDLRRLRDDLKLTQEQAARLLGVSNNTWIRWERGEFKCDEESVGLLRNLATKMYPEPCYEVRREKKIDAKYLAGHIRACDECRRLIKYLATLVKK